MPCGRYEHKLRFENILTKEFLKRVYVIENKDLIQISKETGICTLTIKKYLMKENLYIPERHLIYINLIGKRFGKLVVLNKTESIGAKATWLCQCDCGNKKEIIGQSLRLGNTKSCGCLQADSRFNGHNEISGTYWASLRKGAKERGLKFDITIEYIWELFIAQNKKCA